MKKRLPALIMAFALMLQITALAIKAETVTKTAPYGSTKITFTADDFLNAYDNEGNQTATLAKVRVTSLPSEGTLKITEDDADRNVATDEEILIEVVGNMFYETAAGYHGTSTFTWIAVDANGNKSVDAAPVTLTIEEPRPTALDITAETSKNTALDYSLSATDPLDRALVYSVVSNPTEGGTVTITDTATGAFTYTPATDYTGTDTFTYKVTAAGGVDSNTATVTITVKAAAVDETPEIAILQYADMQSHWGLTSAGSLATLDILVGEKIQGKYYFHPDEEVTRGEFILWLNSAIGLEPSDITTTVFDDYVPSWLGGAANAAKEKGFVEGSLENGKLYLHYNSTLTRIEAIKMISAALELNSTTDVTLNYTDLADVPDWGLNALKNLTDYKIIQGDTAGAVKPLAKMTRAEAAEMLFKSYKEYSK